MKINKFVATVLRIVLVVLLVLLVIVCVAFGLFLKTEGEQENRQNMQENQVIDKSIENISEEQILVEKESENIVNDQSDTMVITSRMIGEIPIIEYYDTSTGTSNKPIIILEYGVTGAKESMRDFALIFAKAGCLVVTPDLYLHGERVAISDCSIMEIAVQSGNEIEEILEYYSNSDIVDMDRVGLFGFSLGGMAIYSYLANGTYPVKAVSIVCSTPDWESLLKQPLIYQCYSNGELTDVPKAYRQTIVDFIAENSPYDELLNKTDVIYAVISGGQDEMIPCEGTETFLQEYVANGGTAIYEKNEDMGHEMTMDDLWRVCEFFANYLL